MKTLACLISIFFAAQLFAANTDTPAANTVESFEKLFGVTEGKRRNHTKGFCFVGTLEPLNAEIRNLSTSALFTAPSTVIGRLSHKGGNNYAPDHKPADYGMGLAITSKIGERHMMSMNTLDFFPVATPQAFAELMMAKVQGKEAVARFKSKNTDLQRFKAHAAKKEKVLVPYEGSVYNSVNSFYLVNASGVKTAVRWSFVPAQPQPLLLEPKQDFFFENMQANLKSNGITWNMVVTIANDNDVVENAAIPWTGAHDQLVVAKLVIDSISSESEGQCDDINYDPLILSSGFEASNDPLLQARRLSYAIAFGKRMGEKK